MRKYELTLTSSYVQDWDFPMAIRELIQNGVDQETVNPNAAFTIEYVDGFIRFTNRNTRLRCNTLLLGRSSKQRSDETVGQFGEGYKIAALVLTRLGKPFVIHNNGKNEVWTCRFVNSQRWAERILTFFVEDLPSPSDDLVIEVGNVTEDEWESLSDIWLGFQDYQAIDTSYGQILTDEDQKDRVYVNGLYIQCNSSMEYGYNFKPEYLTLERDRKSCSSWDAERITSKMIQEAQEKGLFSDEAVYEMLEEGKDDISNAGWGLDGEQREQMAEKFMAAFDEKHQDDFDTDIPEAKRVPIPVSGTSDYKKVTAYGGNPVFVPSTTHRLVDHIAEQRMKDLMDCSMESETLTLKEQLERWKDFYSDYLPNGAVEELERILSQM